MYGNALGPATLSTPTFAANATAYPTSLAGTQVTFDGVAAPILYVVSGQIGLQVPFEVSGKTTTHVQVNVNGQLSNEVDLNAVPLTPGMWPTAVNQDGTYNSASNPASGGQGISFYVTGAGQTSPALTDGQFVLDATHLPTANTVVTIGGQTATVLYAGSAPDSVSGQFQIAVQIPGGIAASSTVPVTLSIGGVMAQSGYMIALK